MASSIIVLNQTPTQSATTSPGNETTSQHTKLKINLNDVVVTAAAAVADSIQLSNGSLISPCSINKTGPLLNKIILSEELNSNLAKTLKETSLNKFSMSDSNLHKRNSSGDDVYDENKTKSQEIYISNLTISDDQKNETSLTHSETKHTRFKIRYHYNTYTNYQSYNEDRINSAGSNSSDSSTSSTSPVLSTDSNLTSPLVNDLNTFPDPLSASNNSTANSANAKLDDSPHAFKISSILVSSKLKEEDTKSTDDDISAASSTVKVKMVANLKIQPNTNRSLAATPNETALKRQTAYHEHDASTGVNLDEKSLAVNGKSLTSEIDNNKSPMESPKLAIKSEASMTKKEKKRVSFNDSLLQVHLIPNVSYNSLSIEKFKYQLKTTTITMENNGEFDEENEVINYENIPVASSPSSCSSSSSFSSNTRQSTEPTTKQQVNFNFYKPQQNETSNDQYNNKTSFVLSSSSLISSYHQNETNNYMQTAQAAAANSKMYRTTIFKTFNESSSESAKHANESTSMTRQSNSNKSSINYRINSGHHRSRESNNTSQDNENSTSFSSKFNRKKDTQQVNYRIGSSTTNNATINKNDPIYQNHRSYSSLLANTFSSQPHLAANYSLANQLQIKQQQQPSQQQQQQHQQQQQAQIQIQSNNLSIPFHTSTSSPAVSVLNDESNSRSSTSSPAKTKSSPATQLTCETKNENAILRVNSGTPGKHANRASNKNTTEQSNSETNKNEVHQSLAMSFELTPQLKFLSNLKTPKQTTNIYINNAEIKDLIEDENNKKDQQFQLQQNANRKISIATASSSNQETNLSAPIIANLSAGLFKQKFSTKPGSTKFIFLKSDDKQNDSSFSTNHFNTFNKSLASNKIGFNSSNSIASSSAISNPSGSFSQLSDVVKLDTTNIKNAGVNSNAKNLAMSTVNQLFALKDVNYYVANSTKALRKYHQQQNKTNLNKNNNNSNNVNLINNSANSAGEVTTIRLHSFSQNQIQPNDRQTKSALPLLRSSIKVNQAGHSTNLIVDASTTSKASTPTLSMTPTETKNLNNCFNNLSYRLINTPTLIGNLHKAKTFLYNQTTTSSSANNFEKKN